MDKLLKREIAAILKRASRDFQEAYQCSLKKPLIPQRMMREEVGDHAFPETAYEENPGKYFVRRKCHENI